MRDSDFFTWRRDCFLTFQAMTTANEIYLELQRQTQILEFDYFSLCVRHPVPFTRPKVSMHSSYPAAWMSHYKSENYFAIDPVLRRENFIHGHLPWTDELFADAQVLWDGARDHGLRKGITQCLMLPNHALGFLSVSRASQFGKMMNNEEIELRLQMLVQMALTALLRIEHEMVMPPEMKFSKREKEILKWTAEGKTSAEIAIILSISENTVNFHQKNMQKKFNAPNKTQIACYAAATGLI
ncbi:MULTISPECIES: transcriptional regulator SdiA [Enterobacteriaceae]|uniref:transcriptional regulator SdiA n=1 Tax=Enterobacteriaceae TaxID=543 RepID=UPI001E3D0AD7|nr:transcriptional regulator SdiA [Lelliottia sp. WAP21]